MKITNPIAILGEDIAANHLRKKGYKIIDRNFRQGYGEIDIIALSPKKVLTFIEVKTRTGDQFGTPLEAITSFKLHSLVRTAQYYQLTHPNLPESLRIDAVAVMLSASGNENRIEHVENITG